MLVEQIKNKKFLEETIKELKKENRSADIQLLEKTIGALYLVESLVNTGLNFIFKGGTSLVLLLDEIKRFSVDVDIITEESLEKVEQIVNELIEKQDLFTRVDKNNRDNAVSKRMEEWITGKTDKKEQSCFKKNNSVLKNYVNNNIKLLKNHKKHDIKMYKLYN